MLGWTKMMGEEERVSHIEGNPATAIFTAIPKMEDADLGTTLRREGTKVVIGPVRVSELYRVLCVVSKKYGVPVPYRSPQAMATRINAATDLEAAGARVTRHREAGTGQRLLSVSIETIRPRTDEELFA